MHYRLGGGLFKFAHLRYKTRTSKSSIKELFYADDNATPSSTVAKLQIYSSLVSEDYHRFGMEVNADKMKILVQLVPRQEIPIKFLLKWRQASESCQRHSIHRQYSLTIRIIQDLSAEHLLIEVSKIQQACIQQQQTQPLNKTHSVRRRCFLHFTLRLRDMNPVWERPKKSLNVSNEPRPGRSSTSKGMTNAPTTKSSIAQKYRALKPPFSSNAFSSHITLPEWSLQDSNRPIIYSELVNGKRGRGVPKRIFKD